MALLKTAISIQADIICLQKLFLGNRNIIYSASNFYWLVGTRTDIHIFTVIKKEDMNNIIVVNRTGLRNHFYCLVLDIWDMDGQSDKLTRQIRVVNSYNNYVS